MTGVPIIAKPNAKCQLDFLIHLADVLEIGGSDRFRAIAGQLMGELHNTH